MDTLPAKEPGKRKGRHQRRPGYYNFRLENNDNLDELLSVGAMFPWLETRGFYHALPHRGWRPVQRQLAFLHSEGFFDHLTPPIGSDLGLQNKLVITKQGREYLAARGLLPQPLVYDPEEKKHNRGGDREMTVHTNMHIYFIASLWGAARANLAVRRQLIGDEPLEIPYQFTHEGKFRKGILRPDDFLRLKRGDIKEYYFYEAQNRSPNKPNDLDRSSTLQKVLAYFNIIEEQEFHSKEMGIRKVRVLFTFLTEAKMRNAMENIKALNNPKLNKLLYFQVVPWHGKMPCLYTAPWYRIGLPPIRLDTGEEVVE